MPNFTGKSGGGPSVMKKYGKGKNPIMMTEAQRTKLPSELVDIIDKKESTMKMYGKKGSMTKKYGKHKK